MPVAVAGTTRQEAIKPPGHSEARAVGLLLVAGALLVLLSLLLPHPSGADNAALISIAAGMALVGVDCFLLARFVPPLLVHLLLAATVVATAGLIYVSDIAAGQYGSIFVWATLLSAYFFSRRVAAAHLAWLLLVYAVTLDLVESAAGYSAVTRWIFAAVSLGVVMALTSAVVGARTRAAQRAQRFFELSNDMLCTMDFEGRCVEVNAAWERLLGYHAAELRGKPLLEIAHPADRERARREALELFRGVPSYSLETRVRAKDGSWHWLRTSSTVARDEGLVYARSTDITELKRIESEREDLLAEVQWLADSDALTGLPNRRVLDTQLPREMARARRQGTPLCVALIDIDRFKAFNDTHGHLAGDEVLRQCARAWDDALRAEDTIVRFGGEEFLVLLPDTGPGEAEVIVERLRAATPDGQTCSAGLARWNFAASPDDLIGQADVALYVAKEAGRDRLVMAPDPE